MINPIKPARLYVGDTVALISPASRVADKKDIVFSKERLEQLGLNVILGKHVTASDGYFAGSDAQRADEIFEELMGDDVEKRKIFIQSNARKVSNLDV